MGPASSAIYMYDSVPRAVNTRLTQPSSNAIVARPVARRLVAVVVAVVVFAVAAAVVSQLIKPIFVYGRSAVSP